MSANAWSGRDKVWSWLAASAAPYVWWRATAIEGHQVALVVWDRTAAPCPGCGALVDAPAPFYAGRGEILPEDNRHDCGAAIPPAPAVARWLSEVQSEDDARQMLAQLEETRQARSTDPSSAGVCPGQRQ
ncbi:hypothetical protein GCM10022237_39750 [Nocardioides ginsengisoli]|uniref:Uncharacterized protein n=1 Tax=Streptomyces plumbiresistens TaxID=511811 RepID=A0ABP7U2N8_9ACTN